MENTAVKNPAQRKINLSLKQYGMVLALIAVYVIFAIITGGKNLAPMTVNNIIMQNGYVIILAVGMLLCVLTGNVDLGVGSVVATCGAVAGTLIVDYGVSSPVAMLASLAVGALFGAFVGFFVSKLEIPPFIVTLATMLMGRGICYVILQAQTKGPLPADYTWVSTGFLPTIKVGGVDLICLIVAAAIAVLVILGDVRAQAVTKKNGLPTIYTWQVILKDVIIIGIEGFFFYKLGCYNGIPIMLILVAVVVAIYHFITTQTVAGRQIYAMGGNAKAARLSGR